MEREFLHLERSQHGWHYLFQKLHQIARANAGTQLIAKKPMNIIRNRYRDVLPIDDTRVLLQDDENDYVNANYVKVEEVNRSYILTQGPLQHTCSHFWQMVWEQQTYGIIMLNKCLERGMNKCSAYWPQSDDQTVKFGYFQVEILDCDEESSYRLTRLKLENMESKESRTVLHFHYTRWPDFGVPQTADIFLDFLYAVRSSGVLKPDVGPSVIHCSAGIGRSGTFCLVDVCLAKLEQTRDLSSLDVQSILLDMRRQRLGLIQTPDQLRFSYISIIQGAIQMLGLENSLFEFEDEEEEEEEEEEESESESEEEEDDERLMKKYPNLMRQDGRVSQDNNDIPPPIPPRPPETFAPPPPHMPPPPSSMPPGPPLVHRRNDKEEELSSKKIKLEAEDEEEDEFGFVLGRGKDPHKPNGDVLDESESDELEEEEPPPIPPRSNSLSPEQTISLKTSAEWAADVHKGAAARRQRDIYGDEPSFLLENGDALTAASRSAPTGHFLGARRGGNPPQTSDASEHYENVGAAREGGFPPPVPPKDRVSRDRVAPQLPPRRRESHEEEERALLDELTELERLVSNPASTTKETESDVRRRQQRVEKQARLTVQLESMRERLRQQEGERESTETEWSVPWLMFGFAIMIGYCAYYFLYS